MSHSIDVNEKISTPTSGCQCVGDKEDRKRAHTAQPANLRQLCAQHDANFEGLEPMLFGRETIQSRCYHDVHHDRTSDALLTRNETSHRACLLSGTVWSLNGSTGPLRDPT